MLLRGAVLGLGSVGRHHARILQSSPRVDFVGAVESNGADGGVDRQHIYASLDELLAASHVDFAVVALPTALHEDAAVSLARAGIHVLVEKPLAIDAVEAAAIVAACDHAGVHAAVGHVERHNPAVRALKARVESGCIGQPLAILTERVGPYPERVHDVGVISDLATHDLDLIPWLLDDSIESVSAQTSAVGASGHEHLAAITGRLSGGSVFNAVVDWLSPAPTRRIRVVGTEGTLLADTLACRIARAGDENEVVMSSPVEPLAAQIEVFCDLLTGRRDSGVVSLADGLRAVACADAALRSAREQRVVTL